MIRKLRNVISLFKINPIVMHCNICKSINLDLVDESSFKYKYNAILKCHDCGAMVEVDARWTP